MLPWLARIVGLDNYDFTTLPRPPVRANPRSGLTVRSVPVPACTPSGSPGTAAWSSPASAPPPAPANPPSRPGTPTPPDIPAADLDALGLRPLPREISIVIADPALRATVGGLRQITAPVDELAGLQIHPDTVLIVENKEPALTWRDTTGLVVIHSLGNHLDVLSRLPWIRHDSCWYWGDLDRHGFTLLFRARTMIPQLESLLMGPGDVETYRPLGVKEKLDRYDQPDSTLTPAEASALAALQLTDGKYLRTEQERIPVSDAERALEQARNLMQPNATETSHCVTGCRTLDLGPGGLSALPAGLRTLRPQAAPCRFHSSYAASGARTRQDRCDSVGLGCPVFAVPGLYDTGLASVE